MQQDYIKVDPYGNIDEVKLSRETTQEVESTGFAMINDNTLSGQYFIIKVDDGYYLTKAIGFNLINFS